MRIGLAQINCQVANFDQNFSKILEYAVRAKERHCDIVVFPELCLFGYWPSDLLERKELVQEQLKKLKELSQKIPKELGVLIGAVTPNPKKTGKLYHNSAVFLEKGKPSKYFHKELLPNYDVFDEARHFEPGQLQNNILKFKGKTILIPICEDIWGWGESWVGTRYPENPIKRIKPGKIDFVLSPNASPFSLGKILGRKSVVTKTAKYLRAPVVYVNQVCGQDELIFDGGSFAVDSKGKTLAQSAYFLEDLNIVDLHKREGGTRNMDMSPIELLKNALVFGLKDFANKNGFDRVHLGLSGGVDSALVACLAVDAFGPNRVTAFALPGPYSAGESFVLAQQLAKNLGCEFKSISVKETYDTALASLKKGLGEFEFGTVNENLQSRLRGLFLTAYGNLKASLLLATGNKDEFAMGYATLYGDMCGGIAPIGDLLKGQVYDLCALYNEQSELIPKRILDREPTAELKPNQKDSDTLPPYPKLDKYVHDFVVALKPAKTIEEKEILKKIYRNEFKRWQAPPIMRVTQHAFGSGRRYPLSMKK